MKMPSDRTPFISLTSGNAPQGFNFYIASLAKEPIVPLVWL
jgi:hypothetical protein